MCWLIDNLQLYTHTNAPLLSSYKSQQIYQIVSAYSVSRITESSAQVADKKSKKQKTPKTHLMS